MSGENWPTVRAGGSEICVRGGQVPPTKRGPPSPPNPGATDLSLVAIVDACLLTGT